MHSHTNAAVVLLAWYYCSRYIDEVSSFRLLRSLLRTSTPSPLTESPTYFHHPTQFPQEPTSHTTLSTYHHHHPLFPPNTPHQPKHHHYQKHTTPKQRTTTIHSMRFATQHTHGLPKHASNCGTTGFCMHANLEPRHIGILFLDSFFILNIFCVEAFTH